MANVAKLKKKAAEFELKRQFDKALAIYIEILDDFDKNPEEVDVALFNRVGDMLLRQGNVADAVDYYERAVDRYAEGGFFNNAIALCNKILRQSPGRSSIYYKLGKISAQKGFKSDAKQNFLEYADRMQKSGRMDEAFRALKEFADLCPDQDDIRLMLADQLSRQSRGEEAIEQLQTLFDRYSSEGRDAEARATLDRISAIDPTYQPRATGPQKKQKGSDLIFLDIYSVDDSSKDEVAVDVPVQREVPRAAPPAAPPPPPPAAADSLRVEPTAAEPEVPEAPEVDMLMGLEITATPVDDAPPGTGMIDLEPTSFGSGPVDAVPGPSDTGMSLDGLETTSFEPPSVEPAADEAVEEFGGLDFLVPPEPKLDESPSATTSDLEFFLPDLDDEEDTPRTAPDGERETPLAGLESAFPPADATASIELDGFGLEDEVDVEPGTEASVPEIGIDEALSGLPLMELELPHAQVVDEARLRQSQEIPELTLDDELDVEQPVARRQEPAAAPEIESGDAAAVDWEPQWAPKAEPEVDLEPEPQAELETEPEAEIEPEPTPPAPAEPQAVPLRARAAAPQGDDRTRRSTIAAEQSVELLTALVEADPQDFALRRRLAEARLDSGDREGGLADLDATMVGYERLEDLAAAASVADEIARIAPDMVRIHQKRVEYAFRTNERARLVGAYLDLAAALLGDGQTDKARTVYKRVLDLAPDDIAAQSGLAALAAEEAEPPAVPQAPAEARPAAATRRPPYTAAPPGGQKPAASPPAPAPAAASRPRADTGAVAGAGTAKGADAGAGAGVGTSSGAADDDSFINLGDWLRDDAGPKSTRMVVEEKEPTGDEEADFAEMLRRFKQGVEENVDAEDHQSHYDLGVAFKEMGLIDEAISEFQRALRAPSNRLPTYEALGQCFVEKGQYQVARAILTRALAEPDVSDEQLIGVLYLLGQSSESIGHHEEALAFYQRVFVVDIQFRDVADRLSAVDQGRR